MAADPPHRAFSVRGAKGWLQRRRARSRAPQTAGGASSPSDRTSETELVLSLIVMGVGAGLYGEGNRAACKTSCGSYKAAGGTLIGVGFALLGAAIYGGRNKGKAQAPQAGGTAASSAPVKSPPISNPTDEQEAQSARSQIDQIRNAPHGPIPQAQAVGTNAGGATTTTITNGTQYTLYVYLSGPTSHVLTLLPGQSQVLSLVAGSYEKAARVSNPSVMPFYGQQYYGSGTAFSENFYIATQ